MDASRYRVVRRIGVGGMAEVLEAIAVGASGFERRVAVKRMLPHEGDTSREHRMFLDEARIASHLHHANIVGVLDYGLADGRPFQVLEYVDGLDVRSLLARGPLPPGLALHIAIAVGHALDHAHGATDGSGRPLGIVHRDVTPANILVSRAGDVKLTDFGIAFAHEKTEHTLVGTTKGTPWFMSPEQMLGDATDARSDVFSLGCVLHTMVTGASPLERPSQQILVANGAELALAPEVPDDVRAVIERATRHDPARRYPTMRELVAALADVTVRYPVVDPRTALREWVAAIDGPTAAPSASPKPGKLDGLLDLALMLDGAAARTFETVATEARAEPATRSERPAPDPATRDERPPPPVATPRRRSRSIGLAAAAAVGLGLGGFGLVRVLGADAVAPPLVDAMPPEAGRAPPSPDAMTALPDAALALAVPDAGGTNVKRPPPERPATLPPPNATTQRWARTHAKAAAAFASWTREHPAAAAALRTWEARTGQGNALLTALTARVGTLEEYAATHPRSGLGALVRRHDLAGLVRWVDEYPRVTLGLARKGGSFPWP